MCSRSLSWGISLSESTSSGRRSRISNVPLPTRNTSLSARSSHRTGLVKVCDGAGPPVCVCTALLVLLVLLLLGPFPSLPPPLQLPARHWEYQSLLNWQQYPSTQVLEPFQSRPPPARIVRYLLPQVPKRLCSNDLHCPKAGDWAWIAGIRRLRTASKAMVRTMFADVNQSSLDVYYRWSNP